MYLGRLSDGGKTTSVHASTSLLKAWAMWVAASVLVVTSTMTACQFAGDRVSHGFWGVRLTYVIHSIQDYYQNHGALPSTIEETRRDENDLRVTLGMSEIDLAQWVRYEKVADDEYVVWLTPEDIAAIGSNQKPRSSVGASGPKRGDVYAKVNARDGRLIERSW